MKNIILITAPPRTGKSTLIKRIITEIGEANCCGFFTEEMRENKERVGFKIKQIGGREFIFSHVNFNTNYKISRYFVDLNIFETFITEFFKNIDKNKVLIVDEIGPMQCLSEIFKNKITTLFNKPIAVLGTLFLDEHPWIDKIKQSDKIDLITISTETRDKILPELVDKISIIKSQLQFLENDLNIKTTNADKYIELFTNAKKQFKNNEIKVDIHS